MNDYQAVQTYIATMAAEFIQMRMGLAGAKENEFIAGHIGNYLPIYVDPTKQEEGEYWYIWLVNPEIDPPARAERIATRIAPNTFVDHEGNCWEYPEQNIAILGTITRVGTDPLLTPEMIFNAMRGKGK